MTNKPHHNYPPMLLLHPPEPDPWWTEPAIQEQQRQLATDFIDTIPTENPALHGRGIVITGGGRYFVSAYITIRVLRMVGCELPIELWHLDDEMDQQMIDIVAPFDVTCHNAHAHARASGTDYFVDHWWKGWQLKACALLYSSFAEVLMTDADSYPVRDPSFVFEWPGYTDRGAIFWPDVDESSRMFSAEIAEALGVPSFTETPTESGQMVVNKVRTWRECNMALHYNSQARYIYRVLYGDKDTFPVAWHRLGTTYSRMWPTSTVNAPGLFQRDFNGDTLFQHRIHDKFRLTNTKFDSTARQGDQGYANGWQHEAFCHEALTELRSLWQ